MYALAMIIDYHYWKCDCKCHHIRQVKKEVLESHSWKQEKASTSSPTVASQNKANPSLAALPTKTLKSSLSSAPKKQPNSLWIDLSSKLANNGKLTSNKHKKCLENNLCLYCGVENHKLDSCPKKQTMVTPKGYGTSATTSTLAAASKKLLEK